MPPPLQAQDPLTRPKSATVLELVRMSNRQSQMLCWPVGTQLLVLRGRVQLTQVPQWHAETMLQPRLDLQAHSSFTLSQEGWVVVRALEEAVVQVQRPVPVGFVQLPALRALWRYLSGWRGSSLRTEDRSAA
jgi:hypothetical protein